MFGIRGSFEHRRGSTTTTKSWLDVAKTHIGTIFAEFLGTAVFMYIYTMALTNAGTNFFYNALSAGLAFATGMFLAFPISVAQLNPAITLGLLVTGNMGDQWGHHIYRPLYYWIAQFAGAIVGVAFGWFCFPGVLGAIIYAGDMTWGRAFLSEIVGTFILVMVYQTILTHARDAKTHIYSFPPLVPLYMGLTVMAIHLALVPITGCGVNPARWLASSLILWRWDSIMWVVYLVGPFIGALLTWPCQYILHGSVIAKPIDDEALLSHGGTRSGYTGRKDFGTAPVDMGKSAEVAG
jgi:glycerol uptake facilitator-like aquaporin